MELPNYSRQLLQQVYTLCKEQQFCDCTIFVGTLHFRAHKLVLSAASLLFKSLLETTETISIDASVVSPEEFSLLLEMMYSGKLPPGKHNLTKIITVADSLQMFDVAVSCKNLLTELMNHSTQTQKVKDVSVKPLTLVKPEARPAAPRSNVISETFAIDKMLLPMSTGVASLASAPEKRGAEKVTKPVSSSKKLDANGNQQTINPSPPVGTTEQFQPQQSSKSVKEKVDCVMEPSSVEGPPSPAQIDSAPTSEGLDKEPPPAKDETVPSPCVPPVQQETTNQLVSETLEKASGELDFLIRYESIFSEALSDPQSVLENLNKCEDIKETEKQVVVECCQAEEGSSTFAKLLEKVKDGQSIVVETVLALLKLCRDTNPSVNEALLEKEPKSEDPVEEVTVDT
ncbi:hypothetical protein AB205_0058230, partial [Aquarana catesbeiana]